MDTFFFLISMVCFTFGLLNLVLLLILMKQSSDAGTWTLLLPFSILTLITFIEVVSYYLFYRYPGLSFPVITLLYEWARILIAFSWTFITFHHYRLNRIDIMRWRQVFIMGGFSAILMLMVPVAIYRSGHLLAFIHGAVIAVFVFAGVKGTLILRRTGNLLPSSSTAVAIAIVSLVSYPAIAIGDFRGWRFPFLDPQLSFWVQAHPLYFLLASFPIAVLNARMLSSFYKPPAKPAAELERLAAGLTERERDVLDLLYKGLRYQEIADALFLSLATVKTHVQHIYRKLEISRREELFVSSVEKRTS